MIIDAVSCTCVSRLPLKPWRAEGGTGRQRQEDIDHSARSRPPISHTRRGTSPRSGRNPTAYGRTSTLFVEKLGDECKCAKNWRKQAIHIPLLKATPPPHPPVLTCLYMLSPFTECAQAERLKLLEESLDGTPANRPRVRRPGPKTASPPKNVGGEGGKDGTAGGKGDRNNQDNNQATSSAEGAAGGNEQQKPGATGGGDGGGTGAGETPHGEGAGGDGEEREVSDEEAFEILTVPDDKWISPDLPPEAGKQQQQLDNHGSAAAHGGGGGGVGGGFSGRSVGAGSRGAYGGYRPAGGTNLAVTPQQQAGLSHRTSQRRL